MTPSPSARRGSDPNFATFETPEDPRPGQTHARPRRRRRRVVYFAFASIWGFLVGTSITLGTATPGAARGGPSILWLLAAATLALIGGVVIAAIYRYGATH